jgi:hypothetical protein
MRSGLISFTFDDGVRSTFEHAAPVLARHSMPATVGVICDHLLWHPPRKAMPLEIVQALAAAGWEIASHSLFHRRMEKLPPTCADEAVTGWSPAGDGIFTAACPWADVGTVVEDTAYLSRCPTFEALGETKLGFFHDVENGLIYVRPRETSDLETRLKLGSMERELQDSRTVLRDSGFEVESFIVPYSLWRQEWGPIARRYYRSILSVRRGLNLPGNRGFLARIPTRADISADAQIEVIKCHIGRGGWPIVCLHHVRPEVLTPLDWPVSEFERLVHWVANSGLTVCTVAEGVQQRAIRPAPHIE